MPHLFISYAKKDTRQLALALADALNNIDGLTAWVDRSLRAGRAWELQIQEQIDRCDAMIVLYSPDINRHKNGKPESYVLTEIAYAKYTAHKPIIPVMAQTTDPPISLTMEHYIDFTMDGLTLDDLVAALCDELEVEHSASGASVAPLPQPADPTAAAIQHARAFTGKRNRDWQPYVTTFSDLKIPDMPFCLVPAGEFIMGSDDIDRAKPAHPQIIEQPYWIAQYPVTNRQWFMAVQAGVVSEPHNIGDVLKWYRDDAMLDAPVAGVDWFMARDFAAWLGCRLPTEREWEYAARGVENWVYPWGNDWNPDFAVWSENSDGKPAVVMAKPEGASWVDARHMSGNVWEWTSSLYEAYPYHPDDGRERDTGNSTDVRRVVRGGSFFFNSDVARAAYRYSRYSSYRFYSSGFRVVVSSILI
ncbi:MAG: TIR domain-containing protein [Chloroflexi bacterium]|nr:MAG: hypothetical protein CUN54_02390 [Phototrophicales bacterium]RMF77938.1 MAG: TIR domain-containing protein [Chloroflexota bacterium]